MKKQPFTAPVKKRQYKPRHKTTSMKQKALWLFSLLFWLVGTCPFFAMKIQDVMTPQVSSTVAQLDTGGTLPLSCLQANGDSWKIYEIYEATGWESGTHIREIHDFTVEADCIRLHEVSLERIVQYASKGLTPGERVDVLYPLGNGPDCWLAVFPDRPPAITDLGPGVEVLAKSDTAMLLSLKSAVLPFMEDWAKDNISMLADARIYSCADMEKLLGNAFLFGLVVGIFILALTLWCCSWHQIHAFDKYRMVVFLNLGVAVLLIASLAIVLHFIQLPSALLPYGQITDAGFFVKEINQFYQALNTLDGQAGLANTLLELQRKASLRIWEAILLAGGIALLLVCAEELFLKASLARKGHDEEEPPPAKIQGTAD